MTRGDLAVALVVAFVAGVAVRDIAQDYRDEEKKAELGRQAYSCPGYLVADKNGDHSCRALQARFEPWWPIPGDPVRLRKKEIRRAIGGNYQEKR